MDAGRGFFREVHKNTWLRRLTAEGKRVTIGPKKSDRTWVVFCIHDDTDALLEGYAEPRLAPSHNPEWTLSLQNTQHVSHALVHNEKEFEFVITLDSGVVRFHAASWEIMQEWVDVLRMKLREMKILSPRENLYTKLPEGRIPLLPTRDPTSPLPATPPVPAAIVPGVECVATVTTTTTTTTSTVAASTSSFSQHVSSSPFENVESTSPSSSVVQFSSANSSDSDVSQIIPSDVTNVQTTAIIHHDAPTTSTATPSLIPLMVKKMTSDQISRSNIQNPCSTDIIVPATEHSGNETHIKEILPNILELSNIDSTTNKRFSNPLIANTENSIRVDVTATIKSESSNSNSFHCVLPSITSVAAVSRSEILPMVSSSRKTSVTTSHHHSIPHLNRSDSSPSDVNKIEPVSQSGSGSSDSTNIMIIQVSNPEPQTRDVFQFPPPENLLSLDDFKSNVHIIPSCLDDISSDTKICNTTQYSSPIKIKNNSESVQQVTTVKVRNDSSSCPKLLESISGSSTSSITKWPEKIILSTSTSGITNISVGNETTPAVTTSTTNISNTSPPHYEKVFLASSSPLPTNISTGVQLNQPLSPSSSSSSNIKLKKDNQQLPRTNEPSVSARSKSIARSTAGPSNSNVSLVKKQNSPSVERKKSKPLEKGRENVPPPSLPPVAMRRTLLTRGATEAVITARPSRIDLKVTGSPAHSNINSNTNFTADRTRSESLDRRRRSSSASETDRRPSNNGTADQQLIPNQQQQQQPQRLQPFRFAQDNKSVNISKKLTLREQQVMQLRREIMHPGGVRLHLRRKDCLGSIAWVDVFGAVWVSGWKQKDHPMLYNALHIGDQLISIAGNQVKTSAEANKIIRNSNTLFLEILIRRIPFGRVYAIRREIEGQCLGLIRDGNSATIVDVVPNSLSARHGLPPKAKTCDGLSLTFWVLTEINGRPLNLFSKENEIHDRLNSVGRDISILVQPLDLITKLRKQLKSTRSFKDYIIQ